MSKKRDDIIDTTSDLLERQGYFATGLNQIVEESGAPKGSLYYYFPGGKDEICEEAIRRSGASLEKSIDRVMSEADTAAEGIAALVEGISRAMEASNFGAGGPLTTVATETAGQNERLNNACEEIYESWRATFERHIRKDGIDSSRAERLSTLVLATMEGAIILSRTYKSTEPLQRAGAELRELLEFAQ
jgi:TetR/AcrR family transcriptional repressor of lmrAB and yxaGH operons